MRVSYPVSFAAGPGVNRVVVGVVEVDDEGRVTTNVGDLRQLLEDALESGGWQPEGGPGGPGPIIEYLERASGWRYLVEVKP